MSIFNLFKKKKVENRYHRFLDIPIDPKIDLFARTDKGEWFNMHVQGWYEGKTNVHTVRLDFYDEPKRTMFLLKYGNGRD